MLRAPYCDEEQRSNRRITRRPSSKLPLRFTMKVKLRIRKGSTLYEAVHTITDADSFGRAFADVWIQLHNRRLQKATSIGALMETLNEGVVEELNGAHISLDKV